MGLTDEQREILLNFFLLYHGFVTRHPDLPAAAFQPFCVHLLERATVLGPFECADTVLADVVYWTYQTIAQVSTLPRTLC